MTNEISINFFYSDSLKENLSDYCKDTDEKF